MYKACVAMCNCTQLARFACGSSIRVDPIMALLIFMSCQTCVFAWAIYGTLFQICIHKSAMHALLNVTVYFTSKVQRCTSTV